MNIYMYLSNRAYMIVTVYLSDEFVDDCVLNYLGQFSFLFEVGHFGQQVVIIPERS